MLKIERQIKSFLRLEGELMVALYECREWEAASEAIRAGREPFFPSE